MNTSDVQSLIATVDDLIFSHTGEHLDDLQQAILEGAFDYQKYAEIAKYNLGAGLKSPLQKQLLTSDF
jgi:hypothetical protein